MASFGRLIMVVLAATLLIQAGASASAPRPVVKGNLIVDSATAQTFVPRGVNFPGFEYACQQGWGYGERGTGPLEADSTVAAIASWKVNTVRLPLNQACWLGEGGMPAGSMTAAGYRQAVEAFVESLNAAGLVAILDLHWTGPEGTLADGLRPMPDSRSGAFWASVAHRFRQNRSVIFDLFNEPHSRWNPDHSNVFSLTWQCWANGGCLAPIEKDTAPKSGLGWYTTTGLRNLVTAVRATGATQPIVLSGIDYANDLRGWLQHRPGDNQLIAGFHNYPVQRCRTAICWHTEIVPVAEQVPVLAAEFGQNDCGTPGHSKRFMEWADGEGIGYLAWAWWELKDLGCRNYALVADLDGTPLPPVGTALHQHLASLPDVTGPAPPGPRTHSRLQISAASWRGRVLNLRFTIDPFVRSDIRVRIRLVRDRSSRTRPRTARRVIDRSLGVSTGRAALRVRIPAGLRPGLLTVSYPGDRKFHPKRLRRPTASVLRLTRSRTRG